MPRRHVSAFTRLDEVSDPGGTDYSYGDVGADQRSRDLAAAG
jgi:hypothetical protein